MPQGLVTHTKERVHNWFPAAVQYSGRRTKHSSVVVATGGRFALRNHSFSFYRFRHETGIPRKRLSPLNYWE